MLSIKLNIRKCFGFCTSRLKIPSFVRRSLSKSHANDPGVTIMEAKEEIPGNIKGIHRFLAKKFTKELAFTIEERQILGIHGLMPPIVKTHEEQIIHCLLNMERYKSDLNKSLYLIDLCERNERLFYRLLVSHIYQCLPLIHHPIITLACQQFSMLYFSHRGMFITIKDKGHVYQVIRNWPETDVRAIIVTDGESVFNLGDIGANAMAICLSKLTLSTAFGGVRPFQCLPICLDVGTNNQSLIDDRFYVGLEQKRVTGDEYYDFLDEFMQAVVRRFGPNCLVHFEDFSKENAFKLLEKYKDCYCVFNNNIQGTAAVILAGILASSKITKKNLKNCKILFQGAGSTAVGIAKLCIMAMKLEGLSEDEAKARIWLVDKDGLIVKNRPKGELTKAKAYFAHDHKPVDALQEAVEILKPTILIGASSVPGAFTPKILEMMGTFNERPVIFTLSTPTDVAECVAEQAYKCTKGKCIFSSESPYDPIEYNGNTFHPGQCDNIYIFPAVSLSAICVRMTNIPEEVFLVSAYKLRDLTTDEQLKKGCLYPSLTEVIPCSIQIAAAIVNYAYCKGVATLHPEPEDKTAYVKSQMYDFNYPTYKVKTYSW